LEGYLQSGAALRGFDAGRGTLLVSPNDRWCWRCWFGSPGQLVVSPGACGRLLADLPAAGASPPMRATNYATYDNLLAVWTPTLFRKQFSVNRSPF